MLVRSNSGVSVGGGIRRFRSAGSSQILPLKLTSSPAFARNLKAQTQADDAVNSICRNIAEGFGCETHGQFASCSPRQPSKRERKVRLKRLAVRSAACSGMVVLSFRKNGSTGIRARTFGGDIARITRYQALARGPKITFSSKKNSIGMSSSGLESIIERQTDTRSSIAPARIRLATDERQFDRTDKYRDSTDKRRRFAPTSDSPIAPTPGPSRRTGLLDRRPQALAICAMAFFIAFSLTFLMWVMTDHSLPKGSSNRALRSP